MSKRIDDTWTFTVNTFNPSTGVAVDADSVPTYRIYEDETTAPILTGNMALLDGANTDGQYSEQVTLSLANGFEPGKDYVARIVATVGGISGVTSRTINIERGTPQTGDNYAIVNHGTYGNSALKTLIDTKANQSLLTTVDGKVDVIGTNVVSLASEVSGARTDITTLLGRLSAARAGYIDNLNIGGNVASNADIQALNQSASRRIVITAVPQFERPEAGSVAYSVEVRTYDGDGAAVNADATPTMTATGNVSGNLSANLSVASNPSTGVYRWSYTVASGSTQEQVRFDVSALIAASTFTLSMYTQVTDFVSITFTTADRQKIVDIHSKLPTSDYLAGTDNADGNANDAVLNQLSTMNETIVATNIAVAQGISGVVADATPETSTFTTNLIGMPDDFFNDMKLFFSEGTGNYLQARIITRYVGDTGEFQFDEPFSRLPVDGEGFFVRSGHDHTVSQIAEAAAENILQDPSNKLYTDELGKVALIADAINNTTLAASAITAIQNELATLTALGLVETSILERLPDALSGSGYIKAEVRGYGANLDPATQVLESLVNGLHNVRQLLNIISAAVAGPSKKEEDNAPEYYATDDPDREGPPIVSSVLDNNGNRDVVEYNPGA